jgi:hypothetical protein
MPLPYWRVVTCFELLVQVMHIHYFQSAGAKQKYPCNNGPTVAARWVVFIPCGHIDCDHMQLPLKTVMSYCTVRSSPIAFGSNGPSGVRAAS